jgi:hypothetical protein
MRIRLGTFHVSGWRPSALDEQSSCQRSKRRGEQIYKALAHDFAHKPIDGSNSTLDFTAAEDSCLMDIPGCQVGPGTHAEVLMLDVRRAIGRQRERRSTGLNTGLFVCADDVIIGTQWSALPDDPGKKHTD